MQAAKQMHAIVRRKYGTPDVLTYEEIERPVPGDEDVLVQVHAAGASIGDHIIVTGKPYLIRLTPFGGVPRPRNPVPGACMSGRVEAVGAKVTTFRPGDEVFGEPVTGAFADLVVPAKLIAPKPTNLSFEEAAAVPWAVAASAARCVMLGDGAHRGRPSYRLQARNTKHRTSSPRSSQT